MIHTSTASVSFETTLFTGFAGVIHPYPLVVTEEAMSGPIPAGIYDHGAVIGETGIVCGDGRVAEPGIGLFGGDLGLQHNVGVVMLMGGVAPESLSEASDILNAAAHPDCAANKHGAPGGRIHGIITNPAEEAKLMQTAMEVGYKPVPDKGGALGRAISRAAERRRTNDLQVALASHRAFYQDGYAEQLYGTRRAAPRQVELRKRPDGTPIPHDERALRVTHRHGAILNKDRAREHGQPALDITPWAYPGLARKLRQTSDIFRRVVRDRRMVAALAIWNAATHMTLERELGYEIPLVSA